MQKLFVLLVVLGVASMAFADTMDWYASSTDRNWFNVANWRWGAGGANPTAIPDLTVAGGSVRTYQSGASTFGADITTGQSAQAYYIKIGGAAANANIADITIDGGTMTAASYIMAGSDSTSIRSGKLIMNSGVINTPTLYVGGGTSGGATGISGWLNMIGGTINLSGDFTIGRYANANGYANISGGTIYANDLKMKPAGGSGTVSLDISGLAKIIVNGNITGTLDTYKTNGWITANGDGNGDLRYSYDSAANKTTVWAAPEPMTVCLLGLGALGLLKRKK